MIMALPVLQRWIYFYAIEVDLVVDVVYQRLRQKLRNLTPEILIHHQHVHHIDGFIPVHVRRGKSCFIQSRFTPELLIDEQYILHVYYAVAVDVAG